MADSNVLNSLIPSRSVKAPATSAVKAPAKTARASSSAPGSVLGYAPAGGLKFTNQQDPYLGTTLPTAHGVSGFLDNLGNDVRTSVVGLPTGLVNLATHPVGSVEAMGKSTWQDWSPLFHGNVNQFAHNFYAHPLAPILDVASLFSAGAGIAGRVGKLGVDAGLLKDDSLLGKLGSGSEAIPYNKLGKAAVGSKTGELVPLRTLYKYTSKNPLTKAMQKTTHSLINAGAEHLPKWAGEPLSMDARYTRLEAKMLAPSNVAKQFQIHALVKAGKDLTPGAADYEKYRALINAHSFKQLVHMGDERAITQPLSGEESYIKDPKFTAGKSLTAVKKGNTMEQDAEGFGQKYTTNDITKAYRLPGRNSVVSVPNHAVKAYAQEWKSSTAAVRALYDAPSHLWKQVLLGYNPSLLTHTAVGNFFMYAMHHAGGGGIRGFMDALAQTKGEAAAVRGIGEAARSMQLNPDWLKSSFRDQLNGFARSSGSEAQGVSSKLYKYSMYPLMHAIGDQFIRRAAINAEMRSAPEVQALMKSGMKFNDAAAKALDTTGSKVSRAAAQQLQRRVSQRVYNTMGDYHTMTPGEVKIAKIMPFYTWNRHALRFAKTTALEHPTALNVQAKLSNQGVNETSKLLGEIPSYLLGSIPGSLLGIGSSPGRKSLVETNSLVPLSTVADASDAVRTLVGSGKLKPGDTVASELNPLVANAAQWLSGTNLSSGAPVPSAKGGVAGNVIAPSFESLPQVTLIQRLLQKQNTQPRISKTTGKQSSPFMFSKNKQAAVSGLLGARIEQMSPAAAAKAYDTQQGIKKPKKTPGFSFTGGLSFPK